MRHDLQLPDPHVDRVNDAERAEVMWYHENVTMQRRKGEVVRKQRKINDEKEEKEALEATAMLIEQAKEANGGELRADVANAIYMVSLMQAHNFF